MLALTMHDHSIQWINFIVQETQRDLDRFRFFKTNEMMHFSHGHIRIDRMHYYDSAYSSVSQHVAKYISDFIFIQFVLLVGYAHNYVTFSNVDTTNAEADST